jgi:hypothetical protein
MKMYSAILAGFTILVSGSDGLLVGKTMLYGMDSSLCLGM